MYFMVRWRSLLLDLTKRELEQRYIGSVGGIAWALFRPALIALSYYFVFDLVFKVRLHAGAGTSHFGLYLLAGILPWMALNEGIITGTSSLIDAGYILKKTFLPFELFPARSILVSALPYIPIIFLFQALLMISTHRLDISPVILATWIIIQLALTYYAAILLAILAAAFRDVIQFVALVTNIWIFFSPVFYSLDSVPHSLRPFLWLNPGTPIILGYQAIILKGVIPGIKTISFTFGWLILLFCFSGLVKKRCGEQLVDWL